MDLGQGLKPHIQRKAVWRSSLVAIIALLIFVALVFVVDRGLKTSLSGISLMLTGLVLALVPAGIWLFVFYQQDRLEPEPVGYVGRTFFIGLGLAAALGIPLTNQVFQVDRWLYRGGLTTFLGGVFIVGAIQAFIIYATVRYFLYDLPEFDERTDGVIYAIAAALGYATAINVNFILANRGAALGPGEVFITQTVLAQAAFGGLLGYFLGRAKLDLKPAWWLPAGYLLTAGLYGLFLFLSSRATAGSISTSGSNLSLAGGLLLSGGLVLAVTGLVFYLVDRDVRMVEEKKDAHQPADPALVNQGSKIVIGIFLALLLVGVILWYQAVYSTKPFQSSGVSGAYPASFTSSETAGYALRAVDMRGTRGEFQVRVIQLEAGQTAETAISRLAVERTSENQIYSVLGSQPTTLNGKEAVRQRFALVITSQTFRSMPRLLQGEDYLVTAGDRVIVVTLMAPQDRFDELEASFNRFLSSIQF